MTAPIRAIVVEDDPSWQQILVEILSDSNLCVDVADNLDDAIRLLRSEPHRLALVDLSLEGSDHHNDDGLRALEAIRNLDPGCQSILLTGFATVELAVSVLTQYGAFSFLRKESFNRSQFRELINQALAAPPTMDNAVTDPQGLALIQKEIQLVKTSLTQTRILVVEDDAGWRNILSELLTDAGYGVKICSSFGDAVGVLRREKFSLAVMDLSLSGNRDWSKTKEDGGFEGYQLLTTAREAGIPTIVVSGVASMEEIQKTYKEQGIFAFLEKKSFDRNTFKQSVQEAVEKSTQKTDLDLLTQRERQVFELLAKGMTNKGIADTLVITNNTVKRHLKAIFEKLGVHNRAGAIAKAGGR